MYTTDKALTYLVRNGHHSKYLEYMSPIIGTAATFCDNLYNAYTDAQNRNDVAARVEVRIPLVNAETVLLDIPNDLIKRSIVNFHRIRWWYVPS